MEEFGTEIVHLTLEQICDVNRHMIEAFGGRFENPDNLENPHTLGYALDAISSAVFGRDLYPAVKEKAAALAYHIISRHVFFDGNKRTAVHVAWEFLGCNRAQLQLEPTIVDLATSVAAGSAGHGELLQWLHDHQGVKEEV